jgi:hypothetical protein
MIMLDHSLFPPVYGLRTLLHVLHHDDAFGCVSLSKPCDTLYTPPNPRTSQYLDLTLVKL